MRGAMLGVLGTGALVSVFACGGRIAQGGPEDEAPVATSVPAPTSAPTPSASSTPPPSPKTDCAWDAPFSTIQRVPGTNSPTSTSSFTQRGSPRLTADELTIFFRSVVFDASGSYHEWNVMTATRAKRSDPFGSAISIDALGPTPSAPWITGDGKHLYFSGSALASGGITVATPKAASFAGDVDLKVVDISPKQSAAGYPCLSADGSELWFETSAPAGSGKSYLVYRAVADGSGGFANATPEDELNFADTNVSPVLSSDGLTMYTGHWGYVTPEADFKDRKTTDLDIFVAHRASKKDPFSTPVPVAQLDTDFTELPGWLSPDNCRFYFSKSSSDHPDDALFVAERAPQ